MLMATDPHRQSSMQGDRVTISVSVTDTIANALRHAILQGRLYPGEHLSQQALAQAHAVSKVPVREALMQLHSEGLLQHDRHRGYFLMRLSREEARQIYGMRRWIETELLRSLRWPDAETVEKFSSLQEMVARPHEAANVIEWFDGLVRLRILLFGLSPEHVLLRELMRVWVRTDRLHAFFKPEGDYQFTEALRTRDRSMLLERHSTERDQADAALAEAQIVLPGLWLASDSE